jgi:glycosyltransferase involved in cell wall biosynthesis
LATTIAAPRAAPAAPAYSLPVILYVLGKLDIGGAEMRSLQLFGAIRQRHPDLPIIVYVTSPEPGALNPRFLAAGVRIVQGGGGLRDVIPFWRVCRREKATLVHANVGSTSAYFALGAFLAGVPVRICHYRSTSEGRTGLYARFKVWVGITLIRLFATRIVGVCDGARALARAPDRKWLTLYTGVAGVAPGDFVERPRRRGGPHLLVLGRIAPEKNYLRPVAVFESLARRREGAAATLGFVGTGAAGDLDRLERRVAKSPVSGAIRLSGASHEPLGHLRVADLLLLTSAWEGLPGAVLEALAVGTPVVASDLPGTREIAAVTEGVTLVPLAASDEIWADAVLAALAQARRESIVSAFQASPFHFDAYVDRMAALWGLPGGAAAGPG